ncbi:MAG: class I SAM-dependent methyltransferase, partial [Alphaproteobacteria bacterium]
EDTYWENYGLNEYRLDYYRSRMDFTRNFWKFICYVTKRKKGSLLDVGCGSGLFLKVAKQSGWQVCGMEISPALCEFAKDFSGCNNIVNDLNLLDCSYDIVLMTDVFRFLSDPLGTLKEMTRLCKPGGCIVIREVNICNKRVLHREAKTDMQLLSSKTALNFMSKVGIKNVKIIPSPMSLNTIKSFNRLGTGTRNVLTKLFNTSVELIYFMSLKKWLAIVPEMLIIGFVEDQRKS